MPSTSWQKARTQVQPILAITAKPVLSITARKAAASKKLSALQRKRRRSYRLFCFVMFAGVLALIWFLAVLPFMRIEATKTFGDSGSFSLEMDGCDLDFVIGTEHKVTYSAAWAAFQMKWTNSATDANTPIGAVFGNNIGCEEQPLSSCRYLCLVTVTVPAGSEVEFEVEQSDLAAGGVTTWPLVTVRPGAKLASLQVGEWFAYQQTIAVTVDNATVGALGTYLVRGDVRAHNATLGSVSAVSSGTGSVYLLDVAATRADVALNYRQPDGRVCIATDLDPSQAAFVPASDPWANCDARGFFDGAMTAVGQNVVYQPGSNTDNTASRAVHFLRSTYDKNNDNKVTKDEFKTALGGMKCCGSNCPFSSWCEAEAVELGFGANLKLPFPDFATRLMTTNSTGWFPHCTSSLALKHSGTAAAAVTTKTISQLTSAHGEVVVSLRQGGKGGTLPTVDSAGQATTLPVPRNLTFSPGGALPGFQLAESEVTHLRDTYSPFGALDGTADLFLVIDAVGGAGHPPVRFIYATRVAYLVIDPAHLTFLTASLLKPPIKRERVHFYDGSCVLDTAARDSAAYNLTVAQMHAQIHRALQESAFDDGPLRGALVLVGGETKSQWGQMHMFGFDDDGQMFPWSNESVMNGMGTAITLSTIFGALVGLAMVTGLFHVLGFIQRGQFQKAQAARKTVLTKMGLDAKKELAAEAASGGEDGMKPSWNPFLFPFKLLTTLFIQPIRSKLVNSVAKFARERCKKVAHPGTPGGPTLEEFNNGPFIYMRTFCREYELFCLENDLRLVEERDEIQRTLISRVNVRVQQLVVRRLYGLRWRLEGEKDYTPLVFPKLARRDTAVLAGERPPSPSIGDKKAAEHALLQQFVREKCILDQTPGSFLDFETRGDPTGKTGDNPGGMREGFRPQVFEYFKAKCPSNVSPKDALMPDLRGDEWATHVLPKGVRFRDRCKVRQVRGLKWDLDASELTLSWKWYLIESLAVMLHMCVAFVPQLLLIYYALAMQHTWAVLMCPAGGIDGIPPLLWTDVVPQSFSAFSLSGTTEDRYSLLLLRLVAWESICFMLLSVCRLLLNYTQAPRNKASDAIRWLYSIAMMAHFTWFFSYLGIIGCWLLLAAILNPNRFLPFGCAVLVVVVVATTIGRQMLEAAARLKEMLWKAFSGVLQSKMQEAMDKIAKKVYEEQMEREGRLASDEPDENQKSKPERTEPVTPLDIFMAINTDGTDTLKMDEFKKLFDLLDLDITENQKENLFAFCDADCSGDISEKEFGEGWDMMVEVFLENQADSQGLSKAQILLVVLYTVVMLAMVMTFILFAIGAWQNEGSFNAVVQSALVSGVGKASASLRSKSKAENADNLDELVGNIMNEQKEAVNGE